MAGLGLLDTAALGPDKGAPGLGRVWGRSQAEDGAGVRGATDQQSSQA